MDLKLKPWGTDDQNAITGFVYKPNIASQRVLEKNNFILEGIMRNAVFKDGNIYDMCVYGKYI